MPTRGESCWGFHGRKVRQEESPCFVFTLQVLLKFPFYNLVEYLRWFMNFYGIEVERKSQKFRGEKISTVWVARRGDLCPSLFITKVLKNPKVARRWRPSLGVWKASHSSSLRSKGPKRYDLDCIYCYRSEFFKALLIVVYQRKEVIMNVWIRIKRKLFGGKYKYRN